MKRAICIWLPEWPLQRIIVDRPELKSQPLVLHRRDPRRGQRVVVCCAWARELGARIDMPLAELAALMKLGGRSDVTARRKNSAAIEWHMFEHQPQHDHDALVKLAIWCEQFSPIVGLEDSTFPDCLLLDASNLAHLFAGEANLLKAIEEAFRQRDYQIRVAIADTVGAAWGLAHYADESRSLREAQSSLSEASCTARTPTEVLGPLPVAALRLPQDTLDILSQLGVTTVTQLLRLPRGGLATRLGPQLIHRLDQALGQQAEVIVAHRPPPDFSAAWVLEHPTSRRETVEEMLVQLTIQLSQRLLKHDHAAVQIEAWLEGRRTSRCFQVGLFQPSSNPRHIEDLLRLRLETIQMREPVHGVRLVAVTTVRLNGEQNMLWEDAGSEHELALLVDRLGSRLGKENVFRIQTQVGALPERAYREVPFANSPKARRGGNAARSLPPHRPLWLQQPPLPLSVMSVAANADADGPPDFFQYQNTQHDVARHWGPERIETGWWRGPGVRRDYYRVETKAGYRFWIFRRLADGAWFVHGCFE